VAGGAVAGGALAQDVGGGSGAAAGDPETVGKLFNSLLRLLSTWTARPVMRVYMARAGADVDPAHFQVLRYLSAAGPLRLRDLAAGTNMTPSNASKIVSELVKGGLVSRQVPDHDRRVTMLEATSEGRAAVRQLDRVGREMLAENMAGWSEEDVATLTRLLSRLSQDVVAWTSAMNAKEGSDAGRA